MYLSLAMDIIGITDAKLGNRGYRFQNFNINKNLRWCNQERKYFKKIN